MIKQCTLFTMEMMDNGAIKCIYMVDFVGMSQDEKTKNIKPEIGWFIKKIFIYSIIYIKKKTKKN